MRSCTLRPDGTYELRHDGTDEVLVVSAEELEAAAAAFFPPEAPPVPQEITRRQARLALLFAGLLDSVDAAIDSIPDPMARAVAKIEWNEALTIDRASPLITELAPALGLTEADVDNLFITGAGL